MLASLLLIIAGSTADYASLRLAFCEQAAEVQVGMSTSQVRGILGEPTSRVKFPDNDWRPPRQAWYYSDRVGRSFPNLGTVYFDEAGKVIRVFGSRPPSDDAITTRIDIASFLERISGSSGFTLSSFDSLYTWSLCRDLAALGKDGAAIVLEEYLKVRPVNQAGLSYCGVLYESTSPLGANTGRAIILVKTLLEESAPVKRPTGLSDNRYFDLIVEVVEGMPMVLNMIVFPGDIGSLEVIEIARMRSSGARLRQFPATPPPANIVYDGALRALKRMGYDVSASHAPAFLSMVRRQLKYDRDEPRIH